MEARKTKKVKREEKISQMEETFIYLQSEFWKNKTPRKRGTSPAWTDTLRS